MAEKAILFDSSKCTGCKGCQVACKCWNDLPSPLELNAGSCTGSYQNPPDLGSDTRLIITYHESENGKKHGVNWAFGRRSCMHCTEAACMNVCPTGCLTHGADGFVTYDAEKCIGCQYCRSACPFDVPRHTGINVSGAGIKVNKCDGCPDRIAHGMSPACVSTCQPNALSFGDRDELLAEAHERVEALKERGYENAHLYGESEAGGTHVIEVLKYDSSQYELPENPETQFTGLMGFMKPLAAVAGIATVGGLGVTFARAAGYKRDHVAYNTESHDLVDTDTGEVERHIDVEAGER